MSARSDRRRQLRDWIIETSGKVRLEDLSDDTPIIEHRILSSLQIMDLILFIEKLSGRAIDVDRLNAGSFRNLDTIHHTFLEDAGHGS